MITVLEKNTLSGDHVVMVGRVEIYADSKRGTVNACATSTLTAKQTEEFAEAIKLAHKIAQGKIALSLRPEFPTLACTVGGMPDNSKGYISREALYVSEETNEICVDHHFSPVEVAKPTNKYFLIYRTIGGSYHSPLRGIDIDSLPVKKAGEFPIKVIYDPGMKG